MQEIKFSEHLSVTVLPGMVECSKHLVEKEREYEPQHQYKGGFVACAASTCAFTAELLLKYKLQQEGTKFPQTHDLYCLYQRLSGETKETIQSHFDILVAEAQVPSTGLPAGWDNAESVFRSARRTFEEWRYVVEAKQSVVVDLYALYTALLSVFSAIEGAARNQ